MNFLLFNQLITYQMEVPKKHIHDNERWEDKLIGLADGVPYIYDPITKTWSRMSTECRGPL